MSSEERLFDHGFGTMSSIEWAGRFDGNMVGIRSMPLVNTNGLNFLMMHKEIMRRHVCINFAQNMMRGIKIQSCRILKKKAYHVNTQRIREL